MKNTLFAFIILLVAIQFSCTTVKVVKVTTGKEEGLRYALGKPFIQVVPSPSGDGTYTAELIYLPDQDQTYAVQASSFLTKYSMEIDVDESGILKKVDLTKGGDTHVADGIGAAAEIAKSQLEAKKKKGDDAEAENKANLKAAKEELAKLNDAVTQKTLELASAELELKSLEDAYGGDKISEENKEKIRAAKVLVAKLTAELKVLNDKTAAANTAAIKLLGANEPTSIKAWGPVLFEIKDNYDTYTKSGSVSLVAVTWPGDTKQMQFETIDPVAEATPPPKPPVITTAGISVAVFDINTGIATIPLEFDKPIIKMEDGNSSIKNISTEAVFKYSDKATMTINDKKLNMVFDKKNLPAGKYDLELAFVYKDAEGNKNGMVTINIELK